MHGLRGEGQERREQRLERVDAAERDIQHGRRTRAVGLDERPRRLLGDVLIRERARAHRLGDRSSKTRAFDVRADLVERCGDAVEHARVRLGELARLGDGAEVAVRVDERAVDEVAPVREQLVVVAAHELVPREVGVLRLGAAGGEVVAQRVRVVAAEEVRDPDREVAARRRLLPLHRQVLARDDVRRQVQVALAGAELAAGAVAEQHRGPDHGVEDDVVLAHEVVVARVRVLPPLPPRVRRAAVVRPLDARGEVADHGVEPDVDPLRVLRIAVDRHGHAPVDVARHRARLQLAHEPEREVLDVRPPAFLRGQPAPRAGRRTRAGRGTGAASRGTRASSRR